MFTSGANYYNCVFAGNYSGGEGGGVYGSSTYNDCEIHDNSGSYGGGARNGTFFNCVFSGNSGRNQGAAAYGGTMYNCLVANNSGLTGGGTYRTSLYSCTIISNRSTSGAGGGVWVSAAQEVYNCIIAGNYAHSIGGGVSGWGGDNPPSLIYNCTIVGNSARLAGGGVYFATNWNTIVYNNHAPSWPNYTNAAFFYSLSSPLPDGEGNIEGNPMFVDPGSGTGSDHIVGNYRLTPGSPCMNTGTNMDYMTDPDAIEWLRQDADGNPRIQHGTVDMGAYELRIPQGTVIMFRGN